MHWLSLNADRVLYQFHGQCRTEQNSHDEMVGNKKARRYARLK